MADTTTPKQSTGTTDNFTTEAAKIEYMRQRKSAQDFLRSSTQYILDGFEESQEQHLVLANTILRELTPPDPKNPPDDHPSVAWRLAQVLADSLSRIHDLQIARSFLLGEDE
ncbi:MAG: hypothetical protein IPH35_13505 [Rhodoferax sp.]|nr:hypothetical protein [Rhodoferax sp.]